MIFIVLGFLTGVGIMGGLGLLLVNPSGVETIATSRISLNCCWWSHLPSCLYNLLMFLRHMCVKRALFLNDWSILIFFPRFLGRGDCNTHLSTTHFCSNVSTKRTQSINLVIILDLTHLAAWADLPSIWNAYIIYQLEVILQLCLNLTKSLTPY